ncbi:MAG: multicopper oxidase family protein [Gemmatimonadaceae bacterium]
MVREMILLGLVSRAQPSLSPPVACPPASLYCFELLPPPELPRIHGSVELQPINTAFGVAVTLNGAPRYQLIAHITGLPAPRTIGAYKSYVAWAYTITMDSAIKLGVVQNGRVSLGEIAREQFRLLITAEPSADGRERSGRIVLRGTSPGARLLAHRDLMQPVAPGAPVMSGHEHSSGGWRMPLMAPLGTVAMPGMRHLTPSAHAWLPREDSTLPVAEPRRVVEIRDGDTLQLVARRVRRTIGGHSLVMYGFNGQYPGPLIRATRGATLNVVFVNQLDQPSSVHWHGVRLDNAYDGVPDVTQRAVPPGGRFIYRVHFRDDGIYWYHPHVREDIQQDLGLYGNILVRPPNASWLPPVNREEVLTLDDILMDEDGVLPFGAETPTHALMGRWGNVFLVNGEPRYALSVRRGEVVRFYLTNVSSARVYNLSFGGARMKVVATDAGRFERESWATSVVIAPAERYVVEVRFDTAGEVPLTNRVQALDHMYGTYSPEVDTLGVAHVALGEAAPEAGGPSFATLHVNADVTAELGHYRRYLSRSPDRTLILTLETRDLPAPVAMMLNSLNVSMDWNDGMAMANWVTTGREVRWILRDAADRRENMDIRWRFARGSLVKLRIFNDPTSVHAMAHPIHLHGQRFLVLARNGVPNDNMAWKDTGLIPAGETVDFLVDMANPGTWLLHCHVAEHMGAGMMSTFRVE